MPTESYLYPSIQLEKYTMILNLHIFPVITQTTNTQKMNNSEMSRQKIPNSYVSSSDEKKIKSDQHGQERIKKGYRQHMLFIRELIKKRSYKCQ